MLRVVIIGGVAAGMSAASRLKRHLRDDVDIVVFERGAVVSYGACGIPYYISDHVKSADELIARTPEQFTESGIDVRTYHDVVGVDTTARWVQVKNLATGEQFRQSYDKLIVGSGARANRYPPFDRDYANLYQVRDIEDGLRLKEALQKEDISSVAVVGAGFIGLELADACRSYGKTVTLVELAPRILSIMDPEITEPLAAELERNGVVAHTATKVIGVAAEVGRITGLTLEGEKNGSLPVDMVINCAGISPNTDFIQNVDKAKNGAIIVNDRMETSAAHVYAAGDSSIMRSSITGELQYAPLGTNANKQGRIIADLLAGKEPAPFGLLGSMALKLFGLDAAKVGLSEEDAKGLALDYKTNLITGNSYASYYGKEKITVKVVYHAETRRLLGAQAVGQGIVVPRVNYYAVAIAAGMTVDQFGFLDLCYSPPFGGVWDAALIAANTAK